MKARYDGLADWYDTWNSSFYRMNYAPLAEILGPGEGLCLDLGCGTGQYFEVIRDTERIPLGLDRSADQLRLARTRTGGPLLQADAGRLPLRDSSLPAVVSLWTSTDLPDFPAMLREAARVLSPGGVFVFYGVHPCFNGPHVQVMEDGVVVHHTYRQRGWHERAPWWNAQGVRDRVGMNHLPLSDFLNAFIASGLTIESVHEPREHAVPNILAVRARA
ncbi:class I SAM-dependent methyltransferase [Nonomuraea sp. NPDC050663]|uniref:class I SAM-dependent methyltransferase n=1 Tax=Nonomuraea sp. NPDC050663 TaxID=3364370 RepID=UPI0037AEE570